MQKEGSKVDNLGKGMALENNLSKKQTKFVKKSSRICESIYG
jgi:hypothetical protein